MLGRLLSSAASSLNPSAHSTPSTRPTTSLESVQEDIHTRGLLFPDASLLHQPHGHLYPLSGGASSPTGASASGFDCYGDLDLEAPRDVRILIAQDATGSQGKAVLYDSNPSPAASPRSAAPEHSQSMSSAGIASAGFLRARRRGTLPSSNATDVYQNQCTGFIKPEDEIKVLTDCMFGAAPLSYKGSSTKVHIIPTVIKAQPKSLNTSPIIGDGQGSFGRGEGRRRSHLAQSYTPSNPPPGAKATNTLNATNTTSRVSERKTVLITRLFSIAIQPPPSLESRDHTPGNSVGSTHSFPFPRMNGASAPPPSKLSKVPRTAMYAIGLILQLPSPAQSTSGGASRSGTLTNHSRRMSNSSNGHEIFSSSFESDKRISSMFTDPPFGFETSLPFSGDGDDRMEVIAQHWDVITRALSSLQSIAQEQIVETLKQSELASLQAAARTRRTVELWPGALMDDEIVKRDVEVARLRVVLGLRVPRVVTGQGRWGVWREEARWVGRWAGGKEQNFFFFNLLTAFLGNHTEWLDALGPPWYRRRHQQQQRACSNEDLAIPRRTVIVASDKMAARRLIFLLSAFLPATSSAGESLSPYRPLTSSSSRGYSQSPPMPSFMRKESLRRTINKRANVTRPSFQAEGQIKFSHALAQGSPPPEDAVTVVDNNPSSRRTSDSPSLRSRNLPIPASNGTASATTTTTVTPATTVPHFSTHRTDSISSGTAAEPRPGSSGSLASLNLMHTLKRNNSTNCSGQSADSGTGSGSLWGSLISGFWSNRRYSSTEVSVTTTAVDEGLGISGVHRPKLSSPTTSSGNKLEEMVAKSQEELYRHDLDEEETPNRTRAPSLDQNASFSEQIGTPPSQAIPAPGRILESPLKLSVDENDGVVDVDIQLPSFLHASLGSPMSSPSTAGFMSVASLEGGGASSFGQTSACPFSSLEQETPANVAGWLKKYHMDFALQAVNPYVGLEHDIKNSMKAEPTPSLATLTPSAEVGPIDKWVDVSTVLIADTRNFSITRLRLKRRVKLASARPSSASSPIRQTNEGGLQGRSQYGNPYLPYQLNPGVEMLDGHLEEKVIEESIMDMDGTLVDAVEKIIAQSHYGGAGISYHQPQQHSSTTPASNASSRSSSHRRGRRTNRADSDATGLPCGSTPMLEIPRGECKNMVLGALEQVVRSVARDNGAEKEDQQQQQQQQQQLQLQQQQQPEQEQATKRGLGNIFRKKVEVESTLREGVRKWLRDIEEAP